MWNLWRLSQATNRPPSSILRLHDVIRRRYGFDGWWAAYQFDQAVTWFGAYVEGLLTETETVLEGGQERMKPKYTGPEDLFRRMDDGGPDRARLHDIRALVSTAKRIGAYQRT